MPKSNNSVVYLYPLAQLAQPVPNSPAPHVFAPSSSIPAVSPEPARYHAHLADRYRNDLWGSPDQASAAGQS